MSTLPFLLSVADELDNINSQSYMDDFGLGFHPHRQYYRTPTIQLSLPASTDWMQQERQQRYRSYKFYDETQNNFQSTAGEDDDDDEHNADADDIDRNADRATSNAYETNMEQRYGSSKPSTSNAAAAAANAAVGGAGGSITSNRQKYASALNSNEMAIGGSRTATILNFGRRTSRTNATANRQDNQRKDKTTHNDDDDDDNIDNSVRMYNLSKKCCKNYHRHAIETNVKDLSGSSSGGGGGGGGGGGAPAPSSYRLHSKCMEGNNSSSDESLQKVSSSIEFLTCFLLKRTRASSSSSSSKNASATGGAGVGGSGKKS